MEGAVERYEKLKIRDSFSLSYRYPIACRELSFVLRFAYSKLPKPLQSLVFEDTLAAFRLLSKMQTESAVSAANSLIQSAEASLPKQKRVVAVKEFRQAMVAYKRQKKHQNEEKDLLLLPQDVLVLLFSFLDLQSLVSAGLVCSTFLTAFVAVLFPLFPLGAESCQLRFLVQFFVEVLPPLLLLLKLLEPNFRTTIWRFGETQSTCIVLGTTICWTWNTAASDDYLWQIHYATYFGDSSTSCGANHYQSSDGNKIFQWKDAFRRKYIVSPLRKFKHSRGNCQHCNSIVWLSGLNCPNNHIGIRWGNNGHVLPISSPSQVVEFVVNESPLVVTCSDSDSDSDNELGLKLWAYQRHI